MNTFDFIQATISHNLKDPHSKALEPDRLSPFACDYDTVCEGRGLEQGRLEIGSLDIGIYLVLEAWNLHQIPNFSPTKITATSVRLGLLARVT